MATQQQFLKAIIDAAPDNLAARLIFANWLEEQGNAMYAEWRRGTMHIPICSNDHEDGFGDGSSYGYSFNDVYFGPGDGRGDGRGDKNGVGEGRGDGFCSFGNGDGMGAGPHGDYS